MHVLARPSRPSALTLLCRFHCWCVMTPVQSLLLDTRATQVLRLAGLPAGVLLDAVGPKLTMLVSGLLAVLACYLFGFQGEAPPPPRFRRVSLCYASRSNLRSGTRSSPSAAC